MSKIKKWEKVLTPILENNAMTRNDDRVLYYEALKSLGYNMAITLGDYLMASELFPSYDTISRVRRRIQSERPELKGSNEEARKERECEFLAYARS